MNECNSLKQSPIAGLAAYGGGAGSVIFGRKGVDGYQIDRSLRFNKADSAYLNRTPSSAGNRKTWTWSGWVKRANSDSDHHLFVGDKASSESLSNSTFGRFYIESNGAIRFSGYTTSYRASSALLRDPSAWYHLVVAVDTTQSTADDRIKIYVNGVQLTDFSVKNNPSQNDDLGFNTTTPHTIGARSRSGTIAHYHDGYLTEVHFIDGQALAATDFGEEDSNGVWQPKEYSGTYGTNGFHLKFDDNSSNAALGTDSSGNSNTWTVNNLSVASGAGNDSLLDTPTNYTADSGNNGGNYCTLNPLANGDQATIANGNLEITAAGSGSNKEYYSTIGMTSGKWYAEYTLTSTKCMIGISNEIVFSSYFGSQSSQYAYRHGAQKYNGGTATSYGDTVTTGDTVGIAFDADGGNLYFYKNGAVMQSGTAAFTGLTSGPYIFGGGENASTGHWNFGARPFQYTPPTGYVSLCTQNLSESAYASIADGSDYFDTKLYTGNGSSVTVSGLAFSPDFVWLKGRSDPDRHGLFDTVRGATKRLQSSETNAEDTQNGVTAFNSDGVAIGNYAEVNGNGRTYVAWSWDAGANSNKTYTVKVVSDSGNKYRFDDFGTSAVTLDLEEGSTYVFDQSDSSNSGHPLRFSTTANGTHGGGTEYTTGVTVTGTPGQAGAKTTIVVAASAPTLFYYCTQHSGMGGQANTNSTAGASNFDGSIQATVKANPTAGFSIVSWTGNGNTGSTLGHGLNAAPKMVIFKNRDGVTNWRVYNTMADGSLDWVYLNLTDAKSDSGLSLPTSTVFTAGGSDDTNGNGAAMINYCFAPVEGYSAFGSFEGTDADPGPFVYLGFRPALIILKNADASQDWVIHDSTRSTHNEAFRHLHPNTTGAENTTENDNSIDILSNGFRPMGATGTNDATNGPSQTIIYAAFAENPFKTARAR